MVVRMGVMRGVMLLLLRDGLRVGGGRGLTLAGGGAGRCRIGVW